MAVTATNLNQILRITIAILFLIHGIYRVLTGIVYDFGLFFTSLGWPLGLQLAWLVTVLEITTSIMIMLGFRVKLSSIYLFIQTLMGVFLVHWQHGWFVVGGGRNGMEYSVLLMVCLCHIAFNHKKHENIK